MQIIPAIYSASFDNFLLTDPQTVREKLASVIGGITLYNAGLPNYPYNFIFEPHYDSDHPESESTDREIKKLIDEKVLFKAYRDGEVLIIE